MNTIASLKECLKSVPDFRKAKGLQYALSDVLSLLIIGLICNANDCVALSNFVSSKKKQLSKYFHFPFEKTPSHAGLFHKTAII